MTGQDVAPASALLVEAGRILLGARLDRADVRCSPETWQALPDAAQRHGMSAWVHAATPLWLDIPTDIAAKIAVTSRLQRLQALEGVAQLSNVVRLLRQAGVESVSLKGPLFSRWVYGDVGMRRFVDLDVLIGSVDRARAVDALGSAGYSLPQGMSAATTAAVYAGTGAWPLGHRSALRVDLHWRPQASLFGSPIGTAALLRDSVLENVAGVAIRIPSPTHAAMMTLLHAAKHLWASLELVLSIAHLVRRRDIEWEIVYRSTARVGAWNGAAAGLALAADLFGVELPPDLEARVRPRAVRSLVDAARAFLAMPDVAGAPLRAEVRAHCAALDNVRRRIEYAAWRLLAPTPLESAWCQLPDRLVALYVPLRLVRLANNLVRASAHPGWMGNPRG